MAQAGAAMGGAMAGAGQRPTIRNPITTLLMCFIPIYGLNYRDNRDQALQWLARLGDPYVATGYDPDGAAGLDWGVYGAPETFLMDARGIVVYKHLGPLSLAVWREEFMPRIQAMSGGEG